jgi:hypothetical protein
MMDGWVIMEVLIRLDLVGILAISMKVILIAAKVLGKNSMYTFMGVPNVLNIRTETQANDVVVAVVVNGVSMVVAQVAEHRPLFYLERICGRRRRTSPIVGDTTSAADGSDIRSYATFYLNAQALQQVLQGIQQQNLAQVVTTSNDNIFCLNLSIGTPAWRVFPSSFNVCIFFF